MLPPERARMGSGLEGGIRKSNYRHPHARQSLGNSDVVRRTAIWSLDPTTRIGHWPAVLRHPRSMDDNGKYTNGPRVLCFLKMGRDWSRVMTP